MSQYDYDENVELSIYHLILQSLYCELLKVSQFLNIESFIIKINKKKAGRSVDLQAKWYAGQASVFSPHKVCRARRANLMRVGPKRAGPARIATPKNLGNFVYLFIFIQVKILPWSMFLLKNLKQVLRFFLISIRSIFFKMCNNQAHSVSMVLSVLRICHVSTSHFFEFFNFFEFF